MFDGKAFVRTLPGMPGVYRMLDVSGGVLYVGKAIDLRRRVASYFRANGLPLRIQRLVARIERIEVTLTHTGTEALLLENDLIKSHKPRFNILLRDDKSYPYIHLSAGPFPRLAFHRGARREPGRYFGPFPSAGSVRESLGLLQKVFPVRQCEDSFFRNRARPCLQYQIHRCSGPCTRLISESDYARDVRHVVMFLEGKSHEVIAELADRMERCAGARAFELAALYRDRIRALNQVQEQNAIGGGEEGDADVISIAMDSGRACVSVTFIRNGRNLGHRAFFPRMAGDETPEEVLTAFLPQHYVGKGHHLPGAIWLSLPLPDLAPLAQALTLQAGKTVRLSSQARGQARRWLGLALLNAREALRRQLASSATLAARLEALATLFGLDAPPERIECFDISHTQGEETVGACVAFGPEGSIKSGYRRYLIHDVAAGDDLAALAQALMRRYRPQSHDDLRAAHLPDVLLIDGGAAQVTVARRVLEGLSLSGMVLLGVSKGPERKPGEEQLHLADGSAPFRLDAHAPALHLIQQIRDEAHRFAITGHRQRRDRARTTSTLTTIAGVGDKRRQALLRHLGGLQEVARAGIEELARVPGISPDLARRIYDHLHPGH